MKRSKKVLLVFAAVFLFFAGYFVANINKDNRVVSDTTILLGNRSEETDDNSWLSFSPEPIATPKPAATSEPVATPRPAETPKPVVTPKPTVQPTVEPSPTVSNYILNTNTHKFHYPWCSSVDQMKEKNKWYYSGTRDSIIEMGYVPCKRCNP